MAVLLPNTTLLLQRALGQLRDGHGALQPAGYADPVGPYAGRLLDYGNGTFLVCLAPEAAPVSPGDYVLDATGRLFLVIEARLVRNSDDPAADYVRAVGSHPPPRLPIGYHSGLE